MAVPEKEEKVLEDEETTEASAVPNGEKNESDNEPEVPADTADAGEEVTESEDNLEEEIPEEEEPGGGEIPEGLADEIPEEIPVGEAQFQQLVPSDEVPDKDSIDRLLDVGLNLSVELGRKDMQIKDILALGPGKIIELDKLAGEPVDLLVNGKLLAKGEVVVVDENFGVRITELINTSDRIKML